MTVREPFVFFERLDDLPDGKAKMLLDLVDQGGVMVATAYSAADVYGPLRERLLVFALRFLSKEAVAEILRERDADVTEEVIEIIDRAAAGSGHFVKQPVKLADLTDLHSVEMTLENVGGASAAGVTAHRSEAVSAWIKEMRLGNVEEAMYWCAVLLNVYDSNLGCIGRRLDIFAAEDAYGPEAYQTGAAMAILCDKGCYEAAFFGTAYMCKANEWWEHKSGIRECFGRGDAEWKARVDKQEGKIKAPSYALDGHTRAGMRKGDRMDDRFSGDWEGRIQTLAMYRQHGELSPDHGRPTLNDAEWELFRNIVTEEEYDRLRRRLGQG